MKRSAWWQMSVAIATVTLRDRPKRRGFINGLLVVILAYFAIGTWPLSGWLSGGLWRMLIFWGFLGFLLLMLVLLALFDALSVIGEERRKLGLEADPDEDNSGSD